MVLKYDSVAKSNVKDHIWYSPIRAGQKYFSYFYLSLNGINEKLSAHNNREDDCYQNAQSIQKCIKKLNIKFAISGQMCTLT